MHTRTDIAHTLDIDPVQIPGWVSPVDHAESPHGGIPLSLVSNGHIQLLIDPWLNQSPFDAAHVLLNDSETSVVHKIIQPGEENKRFTLDLPAAYLPDGINLLRLQVIRIGQPLPATSEPLKVLYNTPRPGGDVAGNGDNPNLMMTLPADVIADGVNAERAAKGVLVTLNYVFMREKDVITVSRDGRDRAHTVTAAQASAGRVVMTLVASDFWQDNPKFALRFRVTDQLGNAAGPQAFWSKVTPVDVHIREEPEPELDLLKPKVLEAREAGGTVLNFEKDFYTAEFATVEVNYIGSQPRQTVRVKWLGRNFTYFPEIQTVTTAGQTLRFRIPRLEVIDIIGGSRGEVSYTVRKPDTTVDIPSRDLDLTVTQQKYVLGQPTINKDMNNLRVYYPDQGIVGLYTVRMALHGVFVRYGDEINIVEPSYTNIPIPSAWIAENRGRSVIFNYTLNRTGASEPLIFSWCLRLTL
ncbi:MULTISPECIES: hypothetical protein [unclassified Pseudomonas]|uniref:hypothetical protein n=1 Tax=unclassified Pseudomonas TaxID=196821 RepID=UPI001F585E67|nr:MULTISPECIES: hypothetical protein [unclassified Pseudomonas]